MAVRRTPFSFHRSRFLHRLMSCRRQTRPAKSSNQVTAPPLSFVLPHPPFGGWGSVVWWVWWVPCGWVSVVAAAVFCVRVYRFQFLVGFSAFQVSFELVLSRFGKYIFGVRGWRTQLVGQLLTATVLSLLYLKHHQK